MGQSVSCPQPDQSSPLLRGRASRRPRPAPPLPRAPASSQGGATPATTLCHVYDYIEGSNLVYLPQITRDAETPAVLGEPVPVQLLNGQIVLSKPDANSAAFLITF